MCDLCHCSWRQSHARPNPAGLDGNITVRQLLHSRVVRSSQPVPCGQPHRLGIVDIKLSEISREKACEACMGSGACAWCFVPSKHAGAAMSLAVEGSGRKANSALSWKRKKPYTNI